MTFRLESHNDPNEACEVVQTAGLATRPANRPVDGAGQRHPGQALPPPHRKDLAIQYATDPAYARFWLRPSFGELRRP
jgi:hypothetical protein